MNIRKDLLDENNPLTAMSIYAERKKFVIKAAWRDVFTHHYSYEKIEAVIDSLVDNAAERDDLHDTLVKFMAEPHKKELAPTEIVEVSYMPPEDFKLNAVEIEIRVSLIIAISSLKQLELEIAAQRVGNGIYWLGNMEFYAGYHSGAFQSQQRAWDMVEKGARNRWKDDPKQIAKRDVYEQWVRWQQDGGPYKTKSAFARAMLDKYEALASQKVITDKWCTAWAKGEDIPPEYATLPAE